MRLLLLACLALGPVAHGLALEDAGEAALHGPRDARVVRVVGLDAWDAGEPPHVVEVRWLGDGLAGTDARLRPARGSAPWLPLPAAGLAWTVGQDFRATQHGWDGQMLLELRFRMPSSPAEAALVARADGGVDAIVLRTVLLPDAPAVPAPGARVALVAPGAGQDALWSPPEPPPAPPPRAVPEPPLALPISLVVACAAGRLLLGRRQP